MQIAKSGYIFLVVIFCGLAALLCAPLYIHAHTDGRSVEVDAGNYLIDIGYPDPVVAGEQSYFDFKLWQKQPADAASYDDVWVRITRDGKPLFATAIAHLSVGTTGFLFTFPEEGAYQVSARYEKGTESLAETEFTVVAQPGEPQGQAQNSRLSLVISFVFGAGVSAMILLFFKGRGRAVVS